MQNRFQKTSKTRAKSTKNERNLIDIKFKKSLIKILYVSAAILLLISSVFSIYKSYKYSRNLNNLISQIDSECSQYHSNSVLNSFLDITLDSNKSMLSADFYLFNEKSIIKIDLKEIEVDINFNKDKGSIKDYFEVNKVFLNDAGLFRNLNDFFLRELYIRLDFIILGNSEYKFTDYIKDFQKPFLGRVESAEQLQNLPEIKTNICKKSLNDFLNNLNSKIKNKIDIKWSNNLILTDALGIKSLLKDQIRIHISNKTGAESYGQLYSDLFKRYGLNTVKVDLGSNSTNKTEIYKNPRVQKDIYTLDMLQYALGITLEESRMIEKETIYGDINVILGVDLVLK